MRPLIFAFGICVLNLSSTLAFASGTGIGCQGCCSPEMKANTVAVVQGTLKDAATSADFESAQAFQEFVKKSSSMPSSKEKLESYFAAVGVDANDPNALLQFVGARDHSIYYTQAEKNLGLTHTQAEILIQKMTDAVKNLAAK